MTPEEFATRMTQIRDKYSEAGQEDGISDPEGAHAEMDELMAHTLVLLGYLKGVKIFYQQEKWYA